MTIRAMHSAASGMDAFLFNLDTIANNLANAGTTGFKRSRTNFEDLFYEHLKLPGQQDSLGKLTAVGTSVGMGTRVASTQADHGPGSLLSTGSQLDVAIVGDGFFPVQNGGQLLYTRAGSFTVNADGDLVLASADRGRLLDPPISIPQDATEIGISSEGVVSVRQAGSDQLQQIGQIQLARFINPQGLIQTGENLYSASDASGPALIGTPGTENRGTLRQGFLEQSNVEPVQELVNLIKTQRNVELNSQVINVSDQMMQLIANLRRF